MTEKPADQQKGSDQAGPANWSAWKENFERAYGKGTFVSRKWLAQKYWGQAGIGAQTPTSLTAETPEKTPATELAAMQPVDQETLEAIQADLGQCVRCKLSGGRKSIVFGEGNPTAKLMFVGEGPGEQEDLQGRPFVGKAGQLLDKIIEAMGYKRSDVYIANVVKCRPPDNRDPEPEEMAACEGFLLRQIDVVRPKVIVALGGTALKALFHDDVNLTQLRGRFTEYRGTKLMPTYHPAFLLQNPEAKKDVWEDMKKVKAELERK